MVTAVINNMSWCPANNNNAATYCSYTTNPNLASWTPGTTDGYALTRKRLDELSTLLAIVSDWHGYASTNAKYGNCPRNHDLHYYNYLCVDSSASVFRDDDLELYAAIESNWPSTGGRFELISK